MSDSDSEALELCEEDSNLFMVNRVVDPTKLAGLSLTSDDLLTTIQRIAQKLIPYEPQNDILVPIGFEKK